MSSRKTLWGVAAACGAIACALAAGDPRRGKGPVGQTAPAGEAASRADTPEGKAPPPGGLITRLYDVKDLCRPPRRRWGPSSVRPPVKAPWPGDLREWEIGRTGREGASASEQGNARALAGLIGALRGSTGGGGEPRVGARDSQLAWAGGASVHRLGTVLVITQTPEQHRTTERLLARLRRAIAAPMVTVQAWWVLLEEGQADTIFAWSPGRAHVPAVIGEAAMKRLAGHVLYRAQAIGLDRQKVRATSGRCRCLMTEAVALVCEYAIVRTEVTATLYGAMLEVRPVIGAGARSARLDLESVVSRWQGLRRAGGSAGGKGGARAPRDLDCPQYLLHTLRTTLAVPLGRAVLVGGMTAPGPAKGKTLYLIVKVSTSNLEPGPERSE